MLALNCLHYPPHPGVLFILSTNSRYQTQFQNGKKFATHPMKLTKFLIQSYG